jgi:hypothetical protein
MFMMGSGTVRIENTQLTLKGKAECSFRMARRFENDGAHLARMLRASVDSLHADR